MIKSVLKIENGMVLVFDENDEQIPEYQGLYEKVRGKILADAPLDAIFGHIVTGLKAVTREEWGERP